MNVDVGASRTAVLVCQGRAVADGRSMPGRFSDPTAFALLRKGERGIVEQVRNGVAPKDWRERVDYEMVRACAEVMVPRTIAIDDAVRAKPAPQVVILGAGLDGRAWRMPELAGVTVFEVDHPASQRDKLDRVGDSGLGAGAQRFVPVDFGRDALDVALRAAGYQSSAATTWIWEGVVAYLTRDEVAVTAKVLGALSAPGSRLVVNYQAPALSEGLGRLAMRAMTRLARRTDPLAGEPRRSAWTPGAMRQLLVDDGFAVERDDDLLTVAGRLDLPVRQRSSLRNGRVVVADRA